MVPGAELAPRRLCVATNCAPWRFYNGALSVTGASQDRPAAPGEDERVLAVVLEQLDAQLEQLAEAGTRAIFAESAAYNATTDPGLRRDVRKHVREHYQAALDSFRRRRTVTREDLWFIRRHVALRVEQISVAEFIGAFHAGQRVLWDATLALAQDDASRRAVLGLVTYIVRYFDVATTHAAEVYLEAEQLLSAAGERLRRDVLEDLIAGVVPPPGPRLDALLDTGLDPRGSCLVIAALPVSGPDDMYALRGAAAALARAPRRAVLPLTVIRHDEIVIVSSAAHADIETLTMRLGDLQRRLADQGTALTIGMSTVHQGFAGIPDAYREAAAARDLLAPHAGLVALPAMSTFDYLVWSGNATARRLIPEEIRRFIAQDAAAGGALVATLHAYAAADLSVKQAADDLHIHVNTAHYRLARIAERTGADLRHVADVIELLIAARLAPEPEA